MVLSALRGQHKVSNMRFMLIAIMTVLLSGCPFASTPVVPRIIIQKEYIPVLQCPSNHKDINRPARPPLLIFTLSDEDKAHPGKVVQAYKIDLVQLMQYSEGLEAGFDSYRGMCLFPETGDTL